MPYWIFFAVKLSDLHHRWYFIQDIFVVSDQFRYLLLLKFEKIDWEASLEKINISFISIIIGLVKDVELLIVDFDSLIVQKYFNILGHKFDLLLTLKFVHYNVEDDAYDTDHCD